MCKTESPLFRHDSGSHCRSKVVHHDDGICLMTLQILFELGHHPTRQLVQVLAVHTQEDIRSWHLQILIQRVLQSRVILPTSIYQLIRNTFRFLDGTDDGSHFHEIGTCPCEYTNLLHCYLLALINQIIRFQSFKCSKSA